MKPNAVFLLSGQVHKIYAKFAEDVAWLDKSSQDFPAQEANLMAEQDKAINDLMADARAKNLDSIEKEIERGGGIDIGSAAILGPA